MVKSKPVNWAKIVLINKHFILTLMYNSVFEVSKQCKIFTTTEQITHESK